MKKLLTLIMILICAVSLNAQEIVKKTNDMTDKSYYWFNDSKGNNTSIVLSEDGKYGLSIMPSFSPSKKDKIDIIVEMYHKDMGCVEGGFIVIKFKDDTKIQINNWKPFNCENIFYFTISKYKKELSTKQVDKIMVQNGRGYETATELMSNPYYFIEFFKALEVYEKN